MLRYILLEADGIIFNKLVDNIQYHSLTDLLVELMQINFPVFQVKNDDNDGDDNETSPAIRKEDGN